MITELKSIEPQLKQVLYACVEHVQATKAALYLSVSKDLNEKKYELVTHYQYNAADRKVVNANDDLVDRLAVKRSPFFVNGLSSDQRFAEMLFRQGNDRMLAAPLFARGRLIGFIDMRDKAGRKPFDSPDVNAAQKIADDMIHVLAKNNLFGLAPLALVEDALPQSVSMPTPRGTPALVMPAPAPAQTAGGFSVAAQQAIEAARQFMAKRQLNRETTTRLLNENELESVRLVLPAVLAIPGAQLGAVSAIGHVNSPQFIVSSHTVTDAVKDRLQAHLATWLRRVNQPPLLMRPQITYPFGAHGELESLGPTFSAPLNVYSVEGLVLTVAFDKQPDAAAQRALRLMLRQLEQAVEGVVIAASGRSERVLIAEKLLEPDFQKYPELAEHSREVAVIAQRFARALELPASQVETVRLAALVHDVGLRLLDYERVYRRASLTPEEMRGLAEHPVVGAALVEPLLGPDVAQAVLRHHERVDGKGYPSRMSGQRIPIASRILQIADAWVAMTSPNSYQTPVERDKAAARLRDCAGSQFDAALVERFLRGLTEIVQ
ncbi:MAG TPA: HD domain-containing phosphohydrolase [Thermoanaerobaculia bacterium]|nr:HD domain-containing phosphohydrolase [Thermoanaerobaculia bacterium]